MIVQSLGELCVIKRGGLIEYCRDSCMSHDQRCDLLEKWAASTLQAPSGQTPEIVVSPYMNDAIS